MSGRRFPERNLKGFLSEMFLAGAVSVNYPTASKHCWCHCDTNVLQYVLSTVTMWKCQWPMFVTAVLSYCAYIHYILCQIVFIWCDICILQLTELEAEFENMPPGKPMQTRFLRSQQDLKAKMLERQALGDDQSDNQTGDDILCEFSKFCWSISEMCFRMWYVVANFNS